MQSNQPVQPLARKTIYAHGTVGMPMAVYGYPLAIWIPAHYSGGLGLDLATVGIILMLARLTDVVTDPLIGELSDRWRTPVDDVNPGCLRYTDYVVGGIQALCAQW